ncbi:MAG: hypothetical protein PHU71_00905 [Candidatus Gracilibacteria bacterium]|nr:hypothetical protein [Candidatus Gracilibacteria bacterium]
MENNVDKWAAFDRQFYPMGKKVIIKIGTQERAEGIVNSVGMRIEDVEEEGEKGTRKTVQKTILRVDETSGYKAHEVLLDDVEVLS